jgi:hypothetical protein
MSTLRRSVLVLIFSVLALAGVYAYVAWCDPDWIKDVSLNVGTELFGILATVLLIDAVIRKKEQTERERVVKVAFAQLRASLQQHVTALLHMYKASVSHAPQKLPETLDALFGPDYFVQLAFLDFSKPAPLMSVKPLQWFDYLHMEMEQFKSACTRTIEKYAVFLEAGTVELLEELLASNLIAFLTQVKFIPHIDQKEGFQRQYNFFAGQGMPELIQLHIALVVRLTIECNRHLPAEKAIRVNLQDWSNDIAPQVGSARL